MRVFTAGGLYQLLESEIRARKAEMEVCKGNDEFERCLVLRGIISALEEQLSAPKLSVV